MSRAYREGVRVRRVTVMLGGAANDKETLQAAVRMAARESANVRVVLAAGCSREMFEKHVDFALWDVQERLRLPAPQISLEAPLDAFELRAVETASEDAPTRRELAAGRGHGPGGSAS